jgi:hypothetical protein
MKTREDGQYWQIAAEYCKKDVHTFYGTENEKTQIQIFLFLSNNIIFGQMSSAKYRNLKVKDLWPIAEQLAGVKSVNSFRNRAQLLEFSHIIPKYIYEHINK